MNLPATRITMGAIRHPKGHAMTLPFLCCAAITMVSALVSLGFAMAAIRDATGEARTLARYAAARSLALVGASLAAFNAPPAWLYAVASVMILVQTLDAFIGVTIKSPMKTYGPAAIAAFNLAALA